MFDIARSGYVNLLQPQDSRSREPGDTKEAVAARRRLHDRGITAPLAQAIGETLAARAGDSILDAGCGEGFYLGQLASGNAVGIDISIPAIDAAARRYPACQWVVANADRAIPCASETFHRVLSITARMNAPEFRRVIKRDGRLLVAIPAPDDIAEIRGEGRDRTERTIATFAGLFALEAQRRVTTTALLDAEGVRDVQLSIYRPMQTAPAAAQRMTFSLDLLLFRPVD